MLEAEHPPETRAQLMVFLETWRFSIYSPVLQSELGTRNQAHVQAAQLIYGTLHALPGCFRPQCKLGCP